MMRSAIACAIVTTVATAQAEPLRTYWSVDAHVSASLPVAGTYDYAGFDAYAGRRLLPWLAIEAYYAGDFGNGSYGYPAGCAGPCCGSSLRAWDMQQLGARVVFVPLHLPFFDVSAGLGAAAVMGHERRVPSHSVPASMGCGGAFDGLHGAIAGATFVSFELRPTPHVGVRVTGTIGVADISDFPMFAIAAGPVFWF
jgi:hypothetical protein